MSQAASRERICRRAVLPADTREKAVMRGRMAPGIIEEGYESFSSGKKGHADMARTGLRWIMCKEAGVREGRHGLLT